MKNRPIRIIFFLALMSSVLVHWVNHTYLLETNPASLREGVSVITQDDPSYLAPAENALKGNGWRSNAVGDAAFVTRTPGYGLIYASFRFWLSQQAALIGLLSFQFLMFAFGASAVYASCKLLIVSKSWAFLIALAYAIMPMFSGFLSYTLTEGVTPALVIFFMYFVLRYSKGNQSSLWWSTLVLAFLIIVRPPMVVLLLVYPLLFAKNSNVLNGKKMALALTISVFPMVLWQIYGYSKTEKLPGLHAIYHTDSNDLYRPVHKALWNFHKSWGQEGGEFHNDVNGIWLAALEGEAPQPAIKQLMGHLPKGAIETVGVPNLQWAYETYFQILKTQAPSFKTAQPTPGQTQLELILSDSLHSYTKAYRSEHWVDTWLVVPIQVYWKLAAHSNLSLYVFQKPWRGNVLVEVLRWLSFLVHLVVFMLFPIALVWSFKNKAVFVIGLPIALYLIYLCFVQRGIEERYTLPFLLPMLVMVKVHTSVIINRFRTKNGKTY